MSESADDGLSIGGVQSVLGRLVHCYDMHAGMFGGGGNGQVVKGRRRIPHLNDRSLQVVVVLAKPNRDQSLKIDS